MKSIWKKLAFLAIISTMVFTATGCNSDENKVNNNSQLANIKKTMIDNLENFSYDANIIVHTGIIDTTLTMECKEDRKNEIGYCSTSSYGMQTEQYIDYKNNIEYSKVNSPYNTDSTNGIWTKQKLENQNTNSWLNLSDYIFNIKEESRSDGTSYTGTINSKKLASAMNSMDSNIDINNIIGNDINITVLVNRSNYIEQITFDMEIMGIKESVEINYKNYNSTGNIIIPTEVKDSKQ